MSYIIRYTDGAYNWGLGHPVPIDEASEYDTLEAAEDAAEQLIDVAEIEQGTWWCNVHRREATDIRNGKRCCAPRLGGIMIPCGAVFAPMIVERK